MIKRIQEKYIEKNNVFYYDGYIIDFDFKKPNFYYYFFSNQTLREEYLNGIFLDINILNKRKKSNPFHIYITILNEKIYLWEIPFYELDNILKKCFNFDKERTKNYLNISKKEIIKSIYIEITPFLNKELKNIFLKYLNNYEVSIQNEKHKKLIYRFFKILKIKENKNSLYIQKKFEKKIEKIENNLDKFIIEMNKYFNI